ncbi:MAG TPA: heme-binding protein [Burkholderiales bacterium]|nr:heme-binding protein [Burkholderiales bacterium]
MKKILFAVAAMLLSFAAQAQTPYGPSINIEQARKVIAGATAEARKINVPMAIAVVDTAGILVALEKMDNTQLASVNVAIDKAVSATTYRRPTKVFQDILAGGGAGLRVLHLRGANAVEGGLPIVVDGKIIGAVGLSGGSAEQDGACAKAGADALK